MTHRPGGPSTVQLSISSRPSIERRRTVGSWKSSVPSAAPDPLYSNAGATTTTSPKSATASTSACSPAESMPSSLVTRMRTP